MSGGIADPAARDGGIGDPALQLTNLCIAEKSVVELHCSGLSGEPNSRDGSAEALGVGAQTVPAQTRGTVDR